MNIVFRFISSIISITKSLFFLEWKNKDVEDWRSKVNKGKAKSHEDIKKGTNPTRQLFNELVVEGNSELPV